MFLEGLRPFGRNLKSKDVMALLESECSKECTVLGALFCL